jgi:hypothetical protein
MVASLKSRGEGSAIGDPGSPALAGNGAHEAPPAEV